MGAIIKGFSCKISANIKTLEKEFILKSSYRVTLCNPTKNEPTAGIIIEGHFSIAASEKKVLLKSV